MELTKGQLLVIILMQWIIVAIFGFCWDKTEKELESVKAQLSSEQTLRLMACNSLEETTDRLVDTVELLELTTEHLEGEWNYSKGEATAYAPYDNQSGMCNEGDVVITSTGVDPGPNIIAVDPKRIPYGSSIVIFLSNGERITGIAGDTGGAMRNSEKLLVDVFKYTYEEARTFGRQDVTILWR